MFKSSWVSICINSEQARHNQAGMTKWDDFWLDSSDFVGIFWQSETTKTNDIIVEFIHSLSCVTLNIDMSGTIYRVKHRKKMWCFLGWKCRFKLTFGFSDVIKQSVGAVPCVLRLRKDGRGTHVHLVDGLGISGNLLCILLMDLFEVINKMVERIKLKLSRNNNIIIFDKLHQTKTATPKIATTSTSTTTTTTSDF